jgi:hypothetical protein
MLTKTAGLFAADVGFRRSFASDPNERFQDGVACRRGNRSLEVATG